MQLGPDEIKVGQLLGITEGVVVKLSMGQKVKVIILILFL